MCQPPTAWLGSRSFVFWKSASARSRESGEALSADAGITAPLRRRDNIRPIFRRYAPCPPCPNGHFLERQVSRQFRRAVPSLNDGRKTVHAITIQIVSRMSIQIVSDDHGNGRYNSYRMATESRLKKLRKEAGFKHASDFAREYDIPEPSYRAAENATRPPTLHSAKQYAKLLSKKLRRPIDPLYLIGESSQETPGQIPEAKLVGKVGAGAEIHRLEDQDVLAGIPLDLVAPNCAVIEGDSQYPLLAGWRVFYAAENQGVSEDCIGKLCVVQVKDGPVLLKTLKRGSRKGLFNLESWNAPTREDERLLWAAMVVSISPQ